MKAFCVQDEWGEGYCTIVFHTSNAAARRIGCQELDIEWGEASCRRAPQFDQYAPGPIPLRALIAAAGWWLSCDGPRCSKRVHMADGPDDPDPIFDDAFPQDVFCSEACRDAKRAQA